jgi:hypothetical protein
MTDAAASIADLDAKALAVAPELMAALVNRCGWPKIETREFNRRARPRRYQFVIEYDGSWLEGDPPRPPTKAKPLPAPDERTQGFGMIALVGHVTKLSPEKSAAALGVILDRLGCPADDGPMVETTVSEYRQLRAALNRRRRELALSMSEMDARAGWADGYGAKLLGGVKNLFGMSLPVALKTLKVEMVIRPIDASNSEAA